MLREKKKHDIPLECLYDFTWVMLTRRAKRWAMLFLSEEGDIQIKRGSTRKLQCGPYWVISALECSDEPIGSCPLRSFTEWAAYIIALNPGLWHSHWTEGSIGFCGWREEGRGDGRKVGGSSKDTHLERRQGRSSAQSCHSQLDRNKLSSPVPQ